MEKSFVWVLACFDFPCEASCSFVRGMVGALILSAYGWLWRRGQGSLCRANAIFQGCAQTHSQMFLVFESFASVELSTHRKAKGLDYTTVLVDNYGSRAAWIGGQTPQLQWPSGKRQGESLDIIKALDTWQTTTNRSCLSQVVNQA